jgi:ABC-type transporter Mla MlaB component
MELASTMELVSTDTLHHRVDGVPTLANAREARALLDTVFAGFVKDGTAEAQAPSPTLEVSLAGIKDGNSVLVSLMLVWFRRARHAGVGILFVDTPPLVVNLIEFTGLDEVLPMSPGTAGQPA